MNYKKVAFSALPLLGLGLLGIGIASAHGIGRFGGLGFGGMHNLSPDEMASRQQTMFEQEAQVLGIGVEDVKNAWADGKTMKELIEEKGLDATAIKARIKDMRMQELTVQLQALVDKGVITADHMNRRLQVMRNADKHGAGKVKRFGGNMFGYGNAPAVSSGTSNAS